MRIHYKWYVMYKNYVICSMNNNFHHHCLNITNQVALGLNEEENANYTKSKDLDEYTRLSSNYDTIASFPNYFRPKGESGHRLYCLDSFHFHWVKYIFLSIIDIQNEFINQLLFFLCMF